MFTLPVSLVASLALAYMLLHRLIRGGRSAWSLTALILGCILQGVVIALEPRLSFLAGVRPVTASLLPPLAFLAFRATALRPLHLRKDLRHLAAPIITLMALLAAPMLLDLIVPGLFLGYGLAILRFLRVGGDGLPLARLEAGDWPRWIWQAIAGALLLSAASDAAIAAAFLFGQGWLRPLIVSGTSSVTLLLIGILGLSPELVPAESAEEEPADRSAAKAAAERPPASPEDVALIARLDHLLTDQALFLDPDLTLARLARRLGVPAKTMSAAINRASGENVSRYVNAYRIRHACRLLTTGHGVTATMLESGFGTKSNFNREFVRVTGVSPSQWLATRRSMMEAGVDRRTGQALLECEADLQ